MTLSLYKTDKNTGKKNLRQVRGRKAGPRQPQANAHLALLKNTRKESSRERRYMAPITLDLELPNCKKKTLPLFYALGV